MKKAIIINGFGGCGKDTFVNIVEKTFVSYHVYSFSSVDKVKEAAKILGWNGDKDLKSRRLLHNLKNLSTEYNDGCLKYMKNKYDEISENFSNKLIFFHIREPREIDKAKEELDAIVIYIKNDNVSRNDHNLEDAGIEFYDYDYIVDNSGSLEDLRTEACKFIDWISAKYFNQ